MRGKIKNINTRLYHKNNSIIVIAIEFLTLNKKKEFLLKINLKNKNQL
jgi:hypothetical protein